MRKLHLLTTAAFLFAGVSLPAWAAYDSLGTVDVSHASDHDVKYSDFGGRMEGLELRASGSDIDCRSVLATFDNGGTRRIFSGHLNEGRPTNVDLPGNSRKLDSLTFNCRARQPRGGRIRILANVGRYQNDWRKSPDWGRVYSRVFDWGSDAINNWVPVGSEHFEGRGDSEMSFTGWNGRNADAIALMPVNADARCSDVTADFRRGRPQHLDVNRGDTLRRGQYYKIDLPGNRRDVERLRLRCHAEGGRDVTIRIFTSK